VVEVFSVSVVVPRADAVLVVIRKTLHSKSRPHAHDGTAKHSSEMSCKSKPSDGADNFQINIIFTLSIADPPLKLTRSDIFNDDENKIVMLVQLFDNGVTLKSKVPLCYGDDLESLLQTLIEFREVADELSFDTNAELFKQFR
jgi:hypothetical protein